MTADGGAEHSTAAVGAPGARAIVGAMSWLGIGHVASQVAWYASLVVLAALVPPRAFGTVAAGLVVIMLASLLMESGSRGSIIVAPQLKAEELRATFLLNATVGIALSVLLALAAEPIVQTFASGGDATALRVLFAGLALTALGVVPKAVLEKQMHFKRHAGVKVASSTVAAVASICAAALGAGVWALVLRQVLFQGLGACLAWIAARDLLPRRAADERRRLRLPRRRHASWFLVLAATDMLALSVDNLVVGHATDAGRLGLYTLAFTLGFAPLTQLSWQIGQVLFPAAAATADLEVVGRRALRTARLMALVLLPAVPPAIALAPVLVPAVLGEQWRGMVAPFQILIVVGVAHGLLNVIGESLSGTGHIRFRALVNVGWSIATVVAVAALVPVLGIRGAALAHLLLFAPLAAAYVVGGTRRLGIDARSLWRALRGVVVPVGVQAVSTAGCAAALLAAGVDPVPALAASASLGLGVVALLVVRLQPRLVAELRGLFKASRGALSLTR